eukprot:1986625-Pyramimonas_sp.AAC.1
MHARRGYAYEITAGLQFHAHSQDVGVLLVRVAYRFHRCSLGGVEGLQNGGDADTLIRCPHCLFHGLASFPRALRGNIIWVLGSTLQCVARGDCPERALYGRRSGQRQLRY